MNISISHKCSLPMECSDYKSCAHGRNCTADCPDFAPPQAVRKPLFLRFRPQYLVAYFHFCYCILWFLILKIWFSDSLPFRCSRMDRSPGACNGCGRWAYCRFDKYVYSPEGTQREYKTMRADSRQGVNLTSAEAKKWQTSFLCLL